MSAILRKQVKLFILLLHSVLKKLRQSLNVAQFENALTLVIKNHCFSVVHNQINRFVALNARQSFRHRSPLRESYWQLKIYFRMFLLIQVSPDYRFCFYV